MCTVSIVAAEGIVRLVCNRDERRSRAAARPPAIHQEQGRRALFPVDPQGGGTWIGVNDHRLAVVLLNRNGDRRWTGAGPLHVSRGRLVRELLLNATSIAGAIEQIRLADGRAHAPYRVVLIERQTMAVVAGGGGEPAAVWHHTLSSPRAFSSSSLGDGLVEEPRRQLFARLLDRGADVFEAQRAFHRHQWPDHPEISVLMARADARTVSRVEVDLEADGATLRYEAVGEGRDSSRAAARLAW